MGTLVYTERSRNPNIDLMAPILTREPSKQIQGIGGVVQAVVIPEDAVVGSCRRLTQLSPTPAPSLLSTSASEPFSDASRSCSEDGAESVVSFAAVAGASGGVGTGGGAGAGGS